MRRLVAPLIIALAAGPALCAAPAAGRLSGDYVEVRTASVFAGPCHYNGELTTTGQDAQMAWHVRTGAWRGTSLSGLCAVADVSAEANLKDETAPRRSVLTIDSRATAAQAKALAGMLMDAYGKALGTVVAVRQAPISFSRRGDAFTVAAEGAGRFSVEAMPDRACCTQPQLVWYKPLIPLKDRRVGFTKASSVDNAALGTEWTKNGQNTAFYGAFAI